MPRLLELCGASSLGVVLGELGWEVVCMDDIESWDFSTYPSGHFDVVVLSGSSSTEGREFGLCPNSLREAQLGPLSGRAEIIAEFFQPRAFLCAPVIAPEVGPKLQREPTRKNPQPR